MARYHATTATAELAYLCRAQPMVFTGKVEVAEKDDSSAMLSNDGPCLLVYTESRRVRVPLNDSYFADPIANLLGDDFHGAVELHGVLIGGRQRLRLRLPSLKNTEPLDILSRVSNNTKPTNSSGGGTDGAAAEAENWVCSACTFTNTNMLGLACEMCQSERPPPPAPAAPAAAAKAAEAVSVVPSPQLVPVPPGFGGAAAAVELVEVEEEEVTEEDEEILLQGVEEGEVRVCSKICLPYRAGSLLSILVLDLNWVCCSFFRAPQQVPEIQSALPRVKGSVDAQRLGGGALAAALLGTTAAGSSASSDGVELTEEATNAVLGYPIDTFQVNCLKAIVQPGVDLMAMAVRGDKEGILSTT